MMMAAAFFALLQVSPQDALLHWMDSRAQSLLDSRDRAIAAVTTREQAETRKREVREKILKVIGGLPDYNGPLNARTTGRIDAGQYVIERVVFESLPGYWVTANLYTPKSPGPHPGILFPLGHWEQGKPAAQQMASNFALKGFVVLAYDPMGQGERLQAYDWRTGKSLAGGATEQHILAGAQSLLAGESFARYRIFDAKRALDYLLSRPEVDDARIGCTGCSGGGTITTYISALDSRIHVAAPSCYMNSFRVLFTGPVGDSEQSPPGFLSAGLDQTDYVELFAPKPWMITSTEKDFFTPAGARIVYEEAKRWYSLYGAQDKIAWVVGPGGHGTPREVREAVYGWMIRWLHPGTTSSTEEDVKLRPAHELWATTSGQASTDLRSRDLYEIIREHVGAASGDLVEWLRAQMPHRPPRHIRRDSRGPVQLETADGMTLDAKLLAPASPGKHAAVLFVQENLDAPPEARDAVASGQAAMILAPRGLPAPATQRLSGDWLANTRAGLIGANLALLRVDDILSAIDALAQFPEIDSTRLTASARGVPGVWLLMAAALDQRISRVTLERTPYSLRAALSNPLSRNLHSAVVPDILRHGDLNDLVRAISPREVIWSDPVDWMGNVVPLEGFRYSTEAN